MSIEEIVKAILVAHGETTLSPSSLLALARELDDCWQKIGELQDALDNCDHDAGPFL
jgi:hypothetical protein